MRAYRAIALAVVLGVSPLLAWGQGRSGLGLDSIRESGNASEAVAAYARAVGAGADLTLAQQAFITRMIDLKSPALAEEQAKEVVQWTDDGQAWAVLAFAEAQNDRIEPALEKAYKGVKCSPSNDFAQSTAGQIIAWYDVRDDRAALGDSVQQKAEDLRKLANRSRAFSRAYENAKRMLTEGVPEDYNGSMPVNVVGSLEELGTYSGYSTTNVPGLVSYWSQPYMYPGYDLEPWWADYTYDSYWAFPPVRLRNVSRDVRYIRMPGDRGFILVDGLGATVVPSSTAYWRNPYYAWQRDPWYAYDYAYGYGYGGPGYGSYYRLGSNWAPPLRNGGYGVLPGGASGYGYGYGYGLPSYRLSRGSYFNAMGTTRLSQRLGGGVAFPGMLVQPRDFGGRRVDGGGPGMSGGGGGRGGRGGRGPR